MLNSTGHESCHINIYEQDELPAQLFDFTPVQHFNINYGQDKFLTVALSMKTVL